MGCFRMLVDYESASPPALPKVPDISPNQAGCKPQRKPTICPPFKPQIQKYISFCPVEVSQNPEETPDHPKEILIFAPFQPFLPSFGAISVLRSCRSCADAISLSGPRGRKERRPLCPCCQVLRLPRESRTESRTEAGPRNGSHPPPNKTRNTTGPAAPMVPECSRCC